MIECVGESERERVLKTKQERGPLLFGKHLFNDSNPIKQREQLAPAHNMH